MSMFGNNSVNLTQKRKNAMESILKKAIEDTAQKVDDGLITHEEANKVWVYAIAALASGIPGAETGAGSADSRRATVSEYLSASIETLSQDVAEDA